MKQRPAMMGHAGHHNTTSRTGSGHPHAFPGDADDGDSGRRKKKPLCKVNAHELMLMMTTMMMYVSPGLLVLL